MLLLIWLTICGTTVASEQNLIFMVPTFIQPGSNFSVEVHSKGLRWEIPLFGAILDGNGIAVEAANANVTPDGVAHIRLKIPQGISQTADYTFSCRPSTQEFKMARVEQHLIFRKDEYFFIQTDKFIYKGGQTVRFRVISLNEYLLPSTSRLNITIQDPKGQKVNEWIQATPIEGVFTRAFELVDQPSFGIWSITSSDGVKVATANIKVMDFYLPKFEVNVQFESQARYALLTDSSVDVKVSARYTFGKDVQGSVSIVGLLQSWDQPKYHGRRFPLIKEGPKNLTSGEAVFSIPMSRIHEIESALGAPLSSDSLIIDAYVTESGITMNGSGSIALYDTSVALKLTTPHKYFKPGLPFIFQTTITQPDGSPLKSQDQKALISFHMNGVLTKTSFTPSTNGIDDHKIDIPSGITNMYLEVVYNGLTKGLNPGSFMSPSNNFLEILPVTNEIKAGTSLNVTILSNKPMPDLHYQIFVRDESVEDGIFHVNNKSMATMTIPVTQLMFPRAHVLVYHFLDDGEAVGDITSFDVGNSAKNKLKVEFSKSQTRPGDNVNLQANGPVGATIYVTAVDKSVLILGNINEMTRSRYTNKLLEHDITPDGKTTDDMLTREGIQIIVSQTDINECYFRPCLNGGTCSDSLPGYACHCPVDVTGKNCESIMGCGLYPCQHGGTCQHIQYDPWYTCNCPHFITGTNCEHITECFMMPCQHGGSCEVTSSGHTCHCKPYTEGDDCQTITECFRQPCQNNGTCTVLPSGHRCQCPKYIVGDNCEVVTDCYSRPCQNGGTCQMTPLGYTCICSRSNTGRNCESFTGLPTATPSLGESGLPTALPYAGPSGLPTATPGIGEKGQPTRSPPMTPSVTLHPPTGDVLLGKTRSRTNFTDTLLWTNTTLGSTGTVDIPVRLGDTVTTWVASAFAMSSTYGLSITSGYAEILSSLKFFVSLITPDHIIFGEKIILQPVVYNYMGSEIPITLIIENSVSQDKVYRNGQIKHGESLSFTVPTSFTTLGTVTVKITAIGLLSNVRDTVVKEIQVKPQGAPQHYNFPVVIDLNSASSLSTAVDVVLPVNVIKGSVKVKAKLSGEILASSIHGLGQLVTYPSGCGEQTMIGLSPDIYIAKYLTATGQMTADLKDKIVAFIKEGYQHELTYQLNDDSFSTFTRDTIGSTWLTAFVIGSFKEAKSFTYVSDDIIIHALDWLMGQQNSDGSFREPHVLYHKDMQGGTKSTVALTAYITIALEASKNFQGETRRSLADALKLALHYLQEQYTSLDDNPAHALALTAYAFTITGTSFSSVSVNKLNAIAHIDGQIKYWTASKTTTVTKREPWKEGQRFGRPIDIETSAYALLTHTARGELGEGLKVMKWIVQQRNPNGGFTSTQDTVVALKALSEFHTALHQATSPSSPHHIHIATTIATTGFSKTFQIDDSNINVLHEVELPVDSGSVNITASGSGLGVVEVAVFYNVDAADGNAAFDLTATVIKESVQSVTVHVCASWKLADSSGMAVIQVGIPTGFEPDVSLIKETNGLKKKEYKSGTVDIYFEQIGRSPLCVDVTANRVGMTVQTQKSQVLVFDYYNPVNQQSVFYLPSALHDAKLCDICPTCTGCGDLIIGK